MPAFARPARFTGVCRSVAGLPEEIRYQVLTLLARLIAKGALADPDSTVAEVRDA